MQVKFASRKCSLFLALSVGISCLSLIAACGNSSEERMAADLECSQIASARSGYNPAETAGSNSSMGKGAAIGAAAGAAVGAVSSKKSKDAAMGAAIGAAAGAGAGALKDREERRLIRPKKLTRWNTNTA